MPFDVYRETVLKWIEPDHQLDNRETINITANIQQQYTLFFYKNVVFLAQAEYSYFSADFRLKIFLYYS